MIASRIYIHALVITVIGLSLVACNPFETTEYSYCVEAESASAFTGNWLKNDGNVKGSIQLTNECARKDRKFDSGSGPKYGKIRWVECLQGPDCDEGGNY
jgi:hypothetical protein